MFTKIKFAILKQIEHIDIDGDNYITIEECKEYLRILADQNNITLDNLFLKYIIQNLYTWGSDKVSTNEFVERVNKISMNSPKGKQHTEGKFSY